MSIFEEHVNNSGVIGGAFLKRGKYKFPDEHKGGAMRYFAPPDFYLGALVKLSAHNVMKVIEVDGASLKTMAEMVGEFPFSDPAKCVAKLGANCKALGVDLKRMLDEATPQGLGLPDGQLPEAALKLALQSLEVLDGINEHELLTICASVATAGGNADAHALCAALE